MDLILSSGYLAFARHLGVLKATDARELRPEAIVGTSSGALVGCLFAAGHSVLDIARRLSARPPLFSISPNLRPWRGAFSAGPIRRELERLLPTRFEQLAMPFAVGVCDELGRHQLVASGDLVQAVLASCAIPWVFESQLVGAVRCHDGGAVDRIGFRAWEEWRPGRRALVHIVERSRGALVEPELGRQVVVRTPRARARWWSHRDFQGQMLEAEVLAEAQLSAAL